MKKFFFLAVTCAIAMFATVISSCGNKAKEPVIPEGEAIGTIRYFIDETTNTVSFIKETVENGKEVIPTEFSGVSANDGFLVGKTDDKVALLKLDGTQFAVAEAFEVLSYFATTSASATADKIVLTTVPANGNHLAYDIAKFTNLAQAGGIKTTVIPLDNGFTIYQNAKGWGFAPSDKDEPVLESQKAIGIVSAKDKVYFWVASNDFTGLVDATGEAIKPLTTAAFKALQKKGKLLWEKDGAIGIEVKAI